MKTNSSRPLVLALMAVFGIALILPATAARAPRPPSVPQPPTPVSGL